MAISPQMQSPTFTCILNTYLQDNYHLVKGKLSKAFDLKYMATLMQFSRPDKLQTKSIIKRRDNSLTPLGENFGGYPDVSFLCGWQWVILFGGYKGIYPA
jgi:hypothetical protein